MAKPAARAALLSVSIPMMLLTLSPRYAFQDPGSARSAGVSPSLAISVPQGIISDRAKSFVKKNLETFCDAFMKGRRAVCLCGAVSVSSCILVYHCAVVPSPPQEWPR
jgi:hypothetical protein